MEISFGIPLMVLIKYLENSFAILWNWLAYVTL